MQSQFRYYRNLCASSFEEVKRAKFGLAGVETQTKPLHVVIFKSIRFDSMMVCLLLFSCCLFHHVLFKKKMSEFIGAVVANKSS